MKKITWLAAIPCAAFIAGCQGADSTAMTAPNQEQSQVRAAARSPPLQGPIGYSFDESVPWSRAEAVFDTAARMWGAMVGPRFYNADQYGYGHHVLIRYEATDYSTLWDVRTTNGGLFREIVMHQSVNGIAIPWTNKNLLFYYFANVIGVDLLGNNPNTSFGVLYRGSNEAFLPKYPHMFQPTDGASYQGNNYKNASLVPLFEDFYGRQYVGWYEAQTAEASGKGLTFNGIVIGSPNVSLPGNSSYVLEYTHGTVWGYANGYVQPGADINNARIDKQAANINNQRFRIFNESNVGGIEITPVWEYSPNPALNPYYLGVGNRRPPYTCAKQLGYVRTGRIDPLKL